MRKQHSMCNRADCDIGPIARDREGLSVTVSVSIATAAFSVGDGTDGV